MVFAAGEFEAEVDTATTYQTDGADSAIVLEP